MNLNARNGAEVLACAAAAAAAGSTRLHGSVSVSCPMPVYADIRESWMPRLREREGAVTCGSAIPGLTLLSLGQWGKALTQERAVWR